MIQTPSNEHDYSPKNHVERHYTQLLLDKPGEKYFLLKAWGFLKRLKAVGELGFRHLDKANLVLFMKIGWRLLSNSTALWVKLLKAKYFANCSFSESTSKAQGSAIWRAL